MKFLYLSLMTFALKIQQISRTWQRQ